MPCFFRRGCECPLFISRRALFCWLAGFAKESQYSVKRPSLLSAGRTIEVVSPWNGANRPWVEYLLTSRDEDHSLARMLIIATQRDGWMLLCLEQLSAVLEYLLYLSAASQIAQKRVLTFQAPLSLSCRFFCNFLAANLKSEVTMGDDFSC